MKLTLYDIHFLCIELYFFKQKFYLNFFIYGYIWLGGYQGGQKKKRENTFDGCLVGSGFFLRNRLKYFLEKSEKKTACQPKTRFTPPFSVYLTMHIFHALSYVHTSSCVLFFFFPLNVLNFYSFFIINCLAEFVFWPFVFPFF